MAKKSEEAKSSEEYLKQYLEETDTNQMGAKIPEVDNTLKTQDD